MTFKSELFEHTYKSLIETAERFIASTPRVVVDFLVAEGGISLYDSVWRNDAWMRNDFVKSYIASTFNNEELEEQLALYKEQYEMRDKICYHLNIRDNADYLHKLFDRFHECTKGLCDTYAPILELRTNAAYECFSQLMRKDIAWSEARRTISTIANAMFTFLCRKAWDEAYSKV